MAQQRHKIKPFKDRCVIYFSRSDECYIAHSIETDQIGTGDCIIDALADLILAVNQCIEVANEDPTVRLFRKAPDSIINILQKATMLPREMYEIAFKKVHGTWPEELKPEFKSKKSQSFTTVIQETVPA